MKKDTMTVKERWLCVINREKPDRIPMFYSGTKETTQKLLKHTGMDSIEKMCGKLHIDNVVYIEPEYVGPSLAENTTVFGAKCKDINYDGGVYTGIDGVVTHHPLAEYKTVEEIEDNYTWPNPDWWDYSKIPEQIRGKEDCIILGGGSEPFMDYKEQLRGTEQALIDLIENPEMVHYCMKKMYDFCYENTTRIYETIPGQVMLSYVAEDLGTQESLLYSPGQIREYFIPHMKRMIGLVHSAGAYAMNHSDGAIREIIPDLIDSGFDVLNPIQWRCRGMEREGLKRDFGDKLIFHGAVDNQYTLAFGSVNDVRNEVRENIDILGRGGGYILGPCHNIQPVSPLENIVAMYEAGYEMG